MWHGTIDTIDTILDTRCSICMSCVRQAHGTGFFLNPDLRINSYPVMALFSKIQI